MLSFVSRAAARRVQTATTSSAAQLVSRQASSPSATAIRSFSVSALVRQPTSAEDKPARKPRAKKTTTAKDTPQEKPTKKAVPKAEKVKKQLTPEEQEARDARQLTLEIRQLKKWALLKKLPKLPSNAWNLYTAENITGNTHESPLGKTKELADTFKKLPASELKDLETRAHANREINIENLKKWVESHEPAQILLANQSRARLAELTSKPYRPIKDDRLPVAPTNSYGLYVKANYDRAFSEHGGDFGKAAKILSQQFKDLSPSEKREFEEKREDLRAAYKGRMDALLEQVEKIRRETVKK